MHGTERTEVVSIPHASDGAGTYYAGPGCMQVRTRTRFHLLSFEGPDPYARAGGIATRISGLMTAIADSGRAVDLWFVGDPDLPGQVSEGLVGLHRWCQWISRHHPGGVYDGEEGKIFDYAQSLPPYLVDKHIAPQLARGEHVVALAEEWQTVGALLHLEGLLRARGLRDQVTLLWNANNTFGFDRIPWAHLAKAATVVTVSRYMKTLMEPYGVSALVIPNGLGLESFVLPDRAATAELRRRVADRTLLVKVARWDPDKRWLLAMDTVAALKAAGSRPLLIARGGLEAHEHEVLCRASSLGVVVEERVLQQAGVQGLLAHFHSGEAADMLVLRSHLDSEARSVLFNCADAVLANSAHEPFGLVGLETMAVGGLACTGASGEDYAIDGENALVLQRNDPREFLALFRQLRLAPGRAEAVRQAGMQTARRFAWSRVIERSLMPRIAMVT